MSMQTKRLPRSFRRNCQGLDMDGNRCRRMAAWRLAYHGSEHYQSVWDSSMPTWVTVELCGPHAATEVKADE